jgi:hypothetical protein
MDVPETWYAGTPDDVHIAYHLIADGPIDVLWLPGSDRSSGPLT